MDVQTAAEAGPYAYAVNTDQTGAMTAAHATLARVDILWLRLDDPAESDGTTVPLVAAGYLAGVASATPAPPSTPARCMVLAWINVPKSGGGSPTVTWKAPYLAGPGGIIPVHDQADRDLITWATAENPVYVHRLDTGVLEMRAGGSWVLVVPAQLRNGARVQMSNGGVVTSTVTALGPDANLRNGSPGFVRTAVGIQVPTAGLYTIHAHTALGGAGLPSRAFIDVTLSALPIGMSTAFDHRLNMSGESAISGTVTLPLAAGTVVGLNAYQISAATRTFDGFLTVIGEPLPTGW